MLKATQDNYALKCCITKLEEEKTQLHEEIDNANANHQEEA